MRSYQQMAGELGMGWCGGILPSGHYCPRNHPLEGEAVAGILHFAERPVTRVNTLAFMKLAALIVEPSLNSDVPWRRVYLRGLIAREQAARLGIRLVPARLWHADKAFVLASVAGLSNSIPLRRQAFDWARH